MVLNGNKRKATILGGPLKKDTFIVLNLYPLGLRPLAGYASLKLYDVMSCFFCLMRNVSCAMIWPVRLRMLFTWGRARAPEAPERAAQKEQAASQPVLWLWSRARAPEGPKTNGKKAETAQHASQQQQKQNGQNNSPTLSAAVFDSIFGVL